MHSDKQRSEKQIEASRINGARSRGPITPEGKRKSSRNSSRHRLLAGTVVLECECRERFLQLVKDLTAEYRPSTATQVLLIETMAAARWRQMRVWTALTVGLDHDVVHQRSGANMLPIRTVAALGGTPEAACRPEILVRYDIAYEGQFNRALNKLCALQDAAERRAERTRQLLENMPSGTLHEPEPNPN